MSCCVDTCSYVPKYALIRQEPGPPSSEKKLHKSREEMEQDSTYTHKNLSRNTHTHAHKYVCIYSIIYTTWL